MRVHAVCCDVLRYTLETMHYDIVLMNFALHYFASDERHMDALLQRVSRGLRTGGAFAGTCVDYRTLGPDKSQGFHVPQNTTVDLDKKPWGRKYRFTLPGCVDLDECVVHFPTLVRIAHRHGLHLVKQRPFNGFIYEMGGVPRVPDVNANYIVFVFRKAASASACPERHAPGA